MPPLHVLVAGAGLAGLTASRALEQAGVRVTLVDARDRVGGRVHTLREGFRHRQHAEAGPDLIEAEQHHVRELARELGLETKRILRHGWGFYGSDARGRPRVRRISSTFEDAARRLKPEIAEYLLAGRRWDSPIAAAIGRQSVRDWMDRQQIPPALSAGLRGLRGFFLADPEELSLLQLVDQFASGSPASREIFRIVGGNDRLCTSLRDRLRARVLLGTVVRRIAQTRRGVRVTLEHRHRRSEMQADFVVSALPASTLRAVRIEPALPAEHADAIARLRYGPATRLALQFDRAFWRRRGRPTAFGSDQPTGAVWDANEEQRGPAGILTLLAGGRASAELQTILRDGGVTDVVQRLSWLGPPARFITGRLVVWEDDPWAGGGYAYFDPSFDARLRPWLARPAGRIVFAGEHTSDRWQGYMNGAVESGLRAAAEIRALAAGHRG